VPTPGHSKDSVSLLLDNGWVFIGDLPPTNMDTSETAAAVSRSWQILRERGATTVYPGHGPVRRIA
jgi:glyoxylase-like metal-dependent hydrolase (beta-lactamase superfamily II)